VTKDILERDECQWAAKNDPLGALNIDPLFRVLLDFGISDEPRFDLFFEPIRVAPDVDGGRLMKDPVQDRRRDHLIVGSFRDECLNVNWFLSMEDAQEKIEKWRQEHNMFRPHSALGDLAPRQFLEKFKSQKTPFLAGPFFGRGFMVGKFAQGLAQ